MFQKEKEGNKLVTKMISGKKIRMSDEEGEKLWEKEIARKEKA